MTGHAPEQLADGGGPEQEQLSSRRRRAALVAVAVSRVVTAPLVRSGDDREWWTTGMDRDVDDGEDRRDRTGTGEVGDWLQ